jgi:hypothetical protein
VEARFSTPVQTDAEAHPASYTMSIGSLSGSVSGRDVALTIHPPSSAEVKEIIELYLYSPTGPSWPVLRYLYFELLVTGYGGHLPGSEVTGK